MEGPTDNVTASARPADPSSPADESVPGRPRLQTDADTVQQDLGRLVLTLIELIRQLVERESLRRVDQGDLSDQQVEAIGLTLMRLEDAMARLCEEFGVGPEELSIDLGPLGRYLPE